MQFLRRLFGKQSAAPAPPPRPLPELPDGADWFHQENRLPYPAWERIAHWVKSLPEADRGEGWNQAARYWAAQFPVLKEGRLMSAESPDFILLTTLEAPSRRWALQTLESAHRAIVSALGDLAWTGIPGKRTVFLLPERLYARYIASYYEDGYMGRSSGIFLGGRGYPHIAVAVHAGNSVDTPLRRTMAHELTHFALATRLLPRWLDESLAMHFEDQIAGEEMPVAERLSCVFEAVTTTELVREFRNWWTSDRMQRFWHGDLWNSADDEQALSYEMSRQLFRALRQEVDGAPQQFRAFIGAARAEDAGEAAAHAHLGFSLGELAARILGDGDWAPQAFR